MTEPAHCPHNDHSHLLLWMALLLVMNAADCVDCSGRNKKLQDLERRVEKLEPH